MLAERRYAMLAQLLDHGGDAATIQAVAGQQGRHLHGLEEIIGGSDGRLDTLFFVSVGHAPYPFRLLPQLGALGRAFSAVATGTPPPRFVHGPARAARLIRGLPYA